MVRENFYRKKHKYDLYSTYMEIETWNKWDLYSIKEKETTVSLVLKNQKTNKKRTISLSKLSQFFKPLIRR